MKASLHAVLILAFCIARHPNAEDMHRGEL